LRRSTGEVRAHYEMVWWAANHQTDIGTRSGAVTRPEAEMMSPSQPVPKSLAAWCALGTGFGRRGWWVQELWTDDQRVGAWDCAAWMASLEGLGPRVSFLDRYGDTWAQSWPAFGCSWPGQACAWKDLGWPCDPRRSWPAKHNHAPPAGCSPRVPEVSRLEWLAVLAVPTPVLSRSPTGPPWRTPRCGTVGRWDTGLQVLLTWGTLLAAQGPENGTVSSS
jgi:hypothetical protein